MLNLTTHRVILISILGDIYADPDLRTILGFKGETAAMLFYDLPRMSVDLDFDLLDESKKDIMFEKMKVILKKRGVLREAREKRYTLFFLMSYEKGQHGIKFDISKRKGISSFELRTYLGVTALVMKRADMSACKLAALLTRRKFAMRDVFDLWFFLKSNWPINKAVLMEKTGWSLDKSLKQALKIVKMISKDQILRGLGELLDTKQRIWAKEKLIKETVFQLRLYQKMPDLAT